MRVVDISSFFSDTCGGIKTYSAKTDAAGSWQIDNLDSGDYYVKVGSKADPFDDHGAPTFRVSPGEQAQVTVVHLDGKQDTFTVTLGVNPLPLPTATPTPTP